MPKRISSFEPGAVPQTLQTAFSTSNSADARISLQERLLCAQEVADRLGVSERWVRDHATRRKPLIRAVKLGPLLRFRWVDVQAFVAEMAAKNDSKRR